MQSARPKLDLIGRVASTGVDSQSDGAFSKMTSGTNPTYVLGVELEVPLDSSLFRGTRAEASARYRIAEIDYKLAKDKLRDSLIDAERGAQALRDNALSSIEIVAKRSRVVREFEASYRQGRTPLVELIRAFNELFDAQLNRARSVGNYMIALNQWAAIRDELVKGEKQ
jgi:outer membrane protein TolC